MYTLRKRLTAAVASSIAWVCLLMVMIISIAVGERGSVSLIISCVVILGATAGAIMQWVVYLRGYVDFAIERRLKEVGN